MTTAASAPLAIDLFCGLGGWTEGLLAEGWCVIGFDIERHDYGTGGYPAQLVLQDVIKLHGSQFKDASLIVASPPCQGYSYRAMPWSRAKALPPPDNSLFEACFRIQREAIEAAGHFIPMVVENVRGAQKWVGRARWNFGSYYLWGDVPALMPMTKAIKNNGGSWFNIGSPGQKETNRNPVHELAGQKGIPHRPKGHWTDLNQNGIKSDDPTMSGWGAAKAGWSGSTKRKAASAAIAKIPFPLARHIAAVWKP